MYISFPKHQLLYVTHVRNKFEQPYSCDKSKLHELYIAYKPLHRFSSIQALFSVKEITARLSPTPAQPLTCLLLILVHVVGEGGECAQANLAGP